MIRFHKHDHPTLYRVLSQIQFTLRNKHLALGPKNLVPTLHPLMGFFFSIILIMFLLFDLR